jgi:UDP-2-acetamido-2,6-beta-L-arabino-hexul-4-ose reductase
MQSEEVIVHADHRGMVFEPVVADDMVGKQNVHVVVTRPGEIRGNHYHERTAEVMTVTGQALVRVSSVAGIEDVEIPAGEARRFRFAPGVTHAIKNTGSVDMLLVAFATEPHDRDNPDTFRNEIL